MGYQESYMRMKDSKDFNKLIDVIKTNGKERFDMAEPVEIITLLKPIKGTLEYHCHPEESYSFEAGEKFVYVVGERSGQRSPFCFFEYCDKVPQSIKKGLEIYATECFPSDDIFENNKEAQMAVHEEFKWK
jgi:hypothetical protein